MADYTAEQLVRAIRNAGTLAELKRMVGPPADENERARQRVERIGQIWKRHGAHQDQWPWHVKQEFERVQREQDEFESMYC